MSEKSTYIMTTTDLLTTLRDINDRAAFPIAGQAHSLAACSVRLDPRMRDAI